MDGRIDRQTTCQYKQGNREMNIQVDIENREDNLFTNFGSTINIVNRKHYPQSVQQDFSQGRYELGGGHQDIHTV